MRNNYISSIYLSKCDLINKLSLTTLHNYPKINTISIQFSLKELSKKNHENISPDIEMNSQIKSGLLFFILFGLKSTIHYHSAKNVIENYSKRNVHSYFTQKIVLNSEKEIVKFVNFLFVENDFKTVAKQVFVNRIINNNLSQSLNINIPLSVFNDITEFCNFNTAELLSKDLNININFIINNKNLNPLMLYPLWYLKKNKIKLK